MEIKETFIKSLVGLEARSVALFIQKASNYKSSIWIEKAERKTNAKSLLGLLSLGIGSGEKIVLSAEGEDEVVAVKELDQFICDL